MKLSLLAVALTAIALTGCGKPKQALPENSTTYGTVDENGQKLDQAPLDAGSTAAPAAAPAEGTATDAAAPSVVDAAKTGAEATVDAAKATAADVKDAAGKSVDVVKGATEGAKKGALDAMGK